MFEMSCQNAGLQSLALFPDCGVSQSLIKTVPFFNTLPQFFHVVDLVLVNLVLQNFLHHIVDRV